MAARPYQDYFELQLRFAARHAALTGAPFTEAVARCTNIRRRLGLWGPAGEAPWASFLGAIQGCLTLGDILGIAMDAHDSAPRQSPSRFGCFTFDPPDPQGCLRLHFMPEERHRQASPLAETKLPERRAELQALFTEVRRLYPEVREVRGLSWLYHVQAYKRLFPGRYVASVAPPTAAIHMNGSSTWGQVLDHRHRVRPGIGERVLAALGSSTMDAPWRAFPLQPLAAAGAADDFFEWFLF